MTGFAVLDFETTGLIPERTDRVIEIGVVLLDAEGKFEKSWSTLVNPKRDVGATHVHGITASQVIDAPEFADISDALIELLSDRSIVAHNASFDMRFLHQELLRAGYPITERPTAVCSMKWAGKLLGTAKLQHCCDALGIDLSDAHTALADAQATSELFSQLLKLGAGKRELQKDHNAATNFVLPRSRGRNTPELVSRSGSTQINPSSWLSAVLSNTSVPGDNEDEAVYLVALSNALLDFHISTFEGRALAEILQDSNLSSERVLTLHREHLGRLAAEAWSDGVLTDDELNDLCAAATYMGLTPSDVAVTLDANRTATNAPKLSFFSAGDRAVFTGELTKPREAWITDIIAAGLVTGAVTKSTRVVVSSDPDSLSGKAATARKYGIPVIDERTFEKYFAEYLAERTAS